MHMWIEIESLVKLVIPFQTFSFILMMLNSA